MSGKNGVSGVQDSQIRVGVAVDLRSEVKAALWRALFQKGSEANADSASSIRGKYRAIENPVRCPTTDETLRDTATIWSVMVLTQSAKELLLQPTETSGGALCSLFE